MALSVLSKTHLNKRYQFYEIKEEISLEHFLPIRLAGVDVSIANALRRIMVDEITTWAFPVENVKLHYNSSQYHREILIERIGFVTLNCNEPLKYDFNDLLFA